MRTRYFSLFVGAAFLSSMVSGALAEESGYREAVEQATAAYVECLIAEDKKLFGPDLGNWSARRVDLLALYPSDLGEVILGCIESAVLENPASCQLGTLQRHRESNAERWR